MIQPFPQLVPTTKLGENYFGFLLDSFEHLPNIPTACSGTRPCLNTRRSSRPGRNALDAMAPETKRLNRKSR